MARSCLIGLLAICSTVYGVSAQIETVSNENCTKDGFYPHPSSCKSFFWCSLRRSLRAIILECDDDQIFDTQTQSCTYPHLSTREECGGSFHMSNEVEDEEESKEKASPRASYRKIGNECIKDGFLPHEDDCGKFFRCVDSGNGRFIKYEFSCAGGTIWDPEILACNHAWTKRDGGCSRRNEETTGQFPEGAGTSTEAPVYGSYPEPPEPLRPPPSYPSYPGSYPEKTEENNNINTVNTQENVNNYGEINTPSSNEQVTDNNQDNVQSKVECIKEAFIPDPKDCKKFHRCVSNGRNGFIKYEFNCGEGTIWDSESNTCNHPSNTKNACGQSNNIDHVDTISTEKPLEEIEEPVTNKETNITSSTGSPQYTSSNTSEQPISTITYSTVSSNITSTLSVSTEEITTESSNIEKFDVCSRDGFIGDSKNCQKFYRCVSNSQRGFSKYEFTCGEGTIWDPEQDTCNYPHSTRRQCGDVSTNQEIQENPQNSDTPTSSTANSIYQHSRYPASTISANADSSRTEGYWTDPTTSVNRNSTETTTSPSVLTSTTISQNNTPSSTTLTPSIEQTSTESNSESFDDCAKEGFIGDSKDCQKFYRCVNNAKKGFIKYEFTCGEGTVWDTEENTCNHPHATRRQCGISDTTPKPGESTDKDNSPQQGLAVTTENILGESQTMTSTSTSTSSITVETIDNQQSSESSTSSVSPEQPTSTTINNQQSATSSSTESSTISSASSVSPEQSTTSSTINNQQNATSSSTESTTITSTSSVSSEQSTTESSDNAQFDECVKDGFIGDSKDCQKFYRCVNNANRGFTKYEFTCGEGTIWDSEENTCNHPHATRRQCGVVSTNASSTESATDQGTSSTTIKPDKVEPSSTESTTNNPSVTPEPEETSVSQSTTSNPEQTTAESSDNKQFDVCTKDGFIGDSKDCQKFYRCVSNSQRGFTKYEFTCGEGTVWDSDLDTCNHPTNVKSSKCSSGSAFKPEQPQTTESGGQEPQQTGSTTENNESSTEQAVATTVSDSGSSTVGTTVISDSGSSTTEVIKATSAATESGASSTEQAAATTISDSGSSTTESASSSTEQAVETTVSGSGSSTVRTTKISDSGSSTTESISSSTAVGTTTSDSGSSTEGTTEISGSGSSTTESTSSSTEEAVATTISDSGSSTIESISSSTAVGTTTNDSGSSTEGTTEISGSGSSTTESTSSSTEQAVATTVSDSGSSTVETIDITTARNESESSTDQTTPVSESGSSTSEKSESTTAVTESSTVQSTSSIGTTNQSQTVQTTPPPKEGGKPFQVTDASCKKEGFFPNLKDCTKFYRCVSNGKGFTKYDFSCGPGTIWDPDLDTCNHPYAVSNKICEQSQQTTEKPSEGGQQSQDKCTEDGYQPNSQDCKKFFRCVGNGKGGFTKYDFTCGEGTMWDTNLQTCNHPYATENRACGHAAEIKPVTDKDIRTDEPPVETTTSIEEVTTITEEPLTETVTEIVDQTTTDIQSTTISEQGTTEIEKEIPTTTLPEETTPLVTTTEVEQQTETTPSESEQSTLETTDSTTTNQSETTTETDATTQDTTTNQSETTTETDTTTQNSTTNQSETTTESETTTQDSTTNQSETTTESDTTTQDSTTNQSETTTETDTTTQDTTTNQSETTTETDTTTKDTTTNQSETTTGTDTGETTTESVESTTNLDQLTTEDNKEIATTEEPSSTTNLEQLTTDSTEQTTIENESTTTTEETTTVADLSTEPSPTTTESESTTTDLDQLVSTQQPAICPISELEGNQISLVCPTGFKRHPKYCNLFYQCTNNPETAEIKILVLSCPSGTIYDERKTQCLAPEKTEQKCTGQIKENNLRHKLSSDVLMEINTDKPLCPSEGTHPLDSTKCLQKFISCRRSPTGKQNIQPFIYQCPDDSTYWPISKRCEKQSPVLGCLEEGETFEDNQFKWTIPVEVQKGAIKG